LNTSHDALVLNQFGPQADAYVASSVHAEGHDLDYIAERTAALHPRHALDLGCGGGHVAYRLARHAGAVTACDLSRDMIAAVLTAAKAQGLDNIAGTVSPAEALPFADDSFDFLACRFTAHHWRDFEAGLREARRVLAPGATAVFADVAAPEEAAADLHLQAVELLRDPSHIRDYRPSEWLAALGRAGFTVKALHTARLRMEFASWTERMRTPEPHMVAIRSLQQLASAATAKTFEIETDGSFTFDTIVVEVV
jgi:ubiquinone/menaquinone biosynthesis C-methylase UbiE